jgi:phospholipase C
VNQAPTTIVLNASSNPSTYGQAVTLTANVSSLSAVPTGNVSFNDGEKVLGIVGLTGGAAVLTTTALTVGTDPLTAVYRGNSLFSPSTSPLSNQVVTQAATASSLNSSLNPSIFGQSVTLTATVSSNSGTPSGNVAFKTGSVTLGTVALNAGVAALTLSSLQSGVLTITSNYRGSSDFSSSTASLTQTVQVNATPSYTLGLAPLNPRSMIAGNSSVSTVTVSPANGYVGSVNLSCSISGGGVPAPICAFNPSSVAIAGAGTGGSVLTVSTSSSTPVGTYSIAIIASDAQGLAPSDGPQTAQLSVTPSSNTAIQHIVVIMQENRTPDNLFQDPVLISRGADIANSGVNSLGQVIPLSPIDLGTVGANPQNYDLSHGHSEFVQMFDGGKMDGADLISCVPAANCPPNAHPNPQFMYVEPSDVQPYFALAEQYTFGDRMFATGQGPSFVSHQFIFSGTSAPTATSPLFASSNPYPAGPSGCLSALTTLVYMIDATGSETNSAPEYPCFEHLALTDLLDADGLTWRYYTPSAGTIWTGPNAIEHICQQQIVNDKLTCTGPDWTNNVIMPETQVLTDIANGDLAQVSWVIPNSLDADHPSANDGSGPSWVASIVNAIGTSPYWMNTVIIVTWDEWGGWYDHVPPTIVNDGVSWGSGFVYGFRVPLIVVSPYAKAGYVSHATHDFGSILKFIEVNFNLPSLGYADASADDMADCFDFTQVPIPFTVIPAPLDSVHFLNDTRPHGGPDDD